MANRNVFKTRTPVKPANVLNAAGGRAYKMSDEASLAQYTVTSCFNRTYYASEAEQVDAVKNLVANCRTEFIARAAVYGHEVAAMKDVPAFLLACLAARGKAGDKSASQLFEKIFPRVITNGKMLFNFVQFVRSGVTGRRSFGTVAKRAIRKWLESKSGNQLFTGSIGANPSMGDVIKMIHPKPESEEKKALYAYLIDKPYDGESLPSKARDLEIFKQTRRVCGHWDAEDSKMSTKNGLPMPDVPFQMLTALDLSKDEWVGIAKNLPWNALRMNLNTLQRHGVFDVPGMTEAVASKLADPSEVRKSNAFPYQLLAAYLNTTDVPQPVRNALQAAMEVATENVQDFGCSVAVCIDTSGSMASPITGARTGSTSKVTCVDVASLAAATIARRNENTILLPFDTRVHDAKSINPLDSIVTNADRLRRFGGGGTDCASALRVLNGLVGNRPELVIYLSDNQSWYGSTGFYRASGTPMMEEWASYKRKTPKAKLVCIDIQPYPNVQVEDNKDVLNCGGFSDNLWPAIKAFASNEGDDFASLVNSVEL